MSGRAVDATLKSARLITALGVGHAAWGAVAYRGQLDETGRAGVAGSVGDGLFQRAHSTDGRAAAFWFMFTAPLTSLCGCLAESAPQHLSPSRPPLQPRGGLGGDLRRRP